MVQRSFYQQKQGNYLFKNNDIDSLVDKVKSFLKDSEIKKLLKFFLVKKTRNYTIFKHYKKLVLLLNLN